MINEIIKYKDKKYISFHTPCHQGRNRYINSILNGKYDLTELDDTDNLFSESGIILSLEEKMAKVLGGNAFYPLVNGATSGVMAALSLFNEKDKIIIDRNCHISAINAIVKNKLNPLFIETDLNEFNLPNPPSIDNIKKLYEENKDAKAIFITNPNYYGMWAECDKIICFAKENNLIIIVDEAHGSHYYYLDKAKTASAHGADIVILSFHKNLPSLTQTGGILINNESQKERIKDNLRCYTSTSPSYLFMLSIDAMNLYMEKRGTKKLKKMYAYLSKVKEALKNDGISVLTDNDPFKLVINTYDAYNKALIIKEKYRIEPEIKDNENITFIVSIHNYKREISILKKAILNVLKEKSNDKKTYVLPKKVMLPYKVKEYKTEIVNTKDAVGRVSGETVIDFPPSVPVVVSGELIEEEMIKFINKETIKCVIL